MPSRLAVLALALPLMALPLAAQQPIQIKADLTDTVRRFYHAEIDIPVQPGPVTLTTPKWIPGHHSPSGPIADITGVVFTANGQTLAWRRDDVDLYEYHLTIPAGVSSVHVHLDCIVTNRITNNLAVLEWEKLMMYPAGTPVAKIPIQATVVVPTGWGIGTSLKPITPYDPQHPAGGSVTYAPVSVEILEDSPVMAGEFFHEYALAPEVSPKHYIDLFGDEPEDVILRPAVLADMSNLVRETQAMYSSHHYNSYHFLLSLTQKGGGGGLEHHESSDNGQPENAYTTDDTTMVNSYLLAHEFTHSWNGKYRRPAGLATPDYSEPMKGELLWVYEGLTDYLGNVLGARAGFTTPEHYREWLALNAATLDYKSGRAWRSTDDTAISVAGLRGSPAWANWRRSTDYYQEGDMFWLDVDTTLRKLTNNQKNLHDFLVLFVARGGSTGPMVLPYTRDELIAELSQVVPNDWTKFFHDRLDAITPHVDLEGVTQGGYKLVYQDHPSYYERAFLAQRGSGMDVWFSLGLAVEKDGTLSDVRIGSPADKARLVPGMKLLAINGLLFSKDSLLKAVKDSPTQPITAIVQNDNLVTVNPIDYHDGPRYPTLVRVEGTPAYLDDITAPLATHVAP